MGKWRSASMQGRARRACLGGLLGLAAFVASSAAHATFGDCVLTIAESTPTSADPGTSPSFTIIASEGSGPSTCGSADISIVETTDTTAGSMLSSPPATVSNGTPEPVLIVLPAPPNGGGSVTYSVTCFGGCDETSFPDPTFTVNVNDFYEISYSDPASGSAFVAGSDSRPLTVAVARNGSPAISPGPAGDVCFDFSSNPDNASLSGSNGSCNTTGVLASVDGAGLATVTFDAAASMPDGSDTIIVASGVSYPSSVFITLTGSDFPQMVHTAGEGQIGTSGQTFPELLVATAVNSANGQVIANTGVTWSISSGNATFFPEGTTSVTRMTDGSGMTSVQVDAGTGPGQVNVRASIDINPDGPADFTLCIDTACGSDFYTLTHNTTASISSSTFDPIPMSVNIFQNGSDPGNGLIIDFAQVSGPGGASFSPISDPADVAGVASTSWTPAAEGDYVLQASFSGVAAKRGSGTVYDSPIFIEFTARIQKVRTLASPMASVSSGQSGDTATLTVTAQDNGGLAAPSSEVLWEVVSGDGSVSPTTSLSDSTSGDAQTTFTFGSTPGAVSVRAYRLNPVDGTLADEQFFSLENFRYVLGYPAAGDDTPSGLTDTSVPLNARLQREGTSTTNVDGLQVHYAIVSTPPSAIASLDPADNDLTAGGGLASVGLIGDTAGTYIVEAQYPFGAPTTMQSYTVTLAEPIFDLVVIDPPGGAIDAEVAVARTLIVELSSGGSPLSGKTIDWTTDSGTLSAPSSMTGIDGRAQIDFTPGMAGLATVNAAYSGTPALGKATGPAPLSENIAVTGFVRDMAFHAQPTPPNYTDETINGVVVETFTFDGSAAAPEDDVVVDFDIISGTATFVGGGTNAQDVSVGGLATSPMIEVGRDLGDIVVRATSPGRTPIDFTLPLTASTYAIRLDGAQANPVSTFPNNVEPLAVVIERTGSSTVAIGSGTVDWSADGGTLGSPTSSSDASGVATNSFSASTTGSYTVTASFDPMVDGVSAPVSTSLTVDVLAFVQDVVIVSGDAQSGQAGTTLTSPLVAAAQDNGAPPASPVNIDWTVTPLGAATFDNTSTPTDPSTGEAQVVVTLAPGASPGAITITATRDDNSAAVNFTATIDPPVTLLTPISGDGQSAFAGETLASPLVVEASDNGAPPASPINVDWTVSPVGAATFDSSTTATDPGTGQAQVTVTLDPGAAPGAITITATRADTGDATSFTATVNSPLVTTLTSVSGDGQSAFAGEPLASPLVVEALDGGSPPASPININWTVSPVGAATVDSTPTATDANGRSQVTVTLDPAAAPGAITITATRADTGDATSFTATVNSPLVTTLTSVSGDGQSAFAGEPLASPLVVEALDGGSPPASPININWTVSPVGAATVDSTPTATDANGRSQVNVTLAAGASPGPVTITATRADTGDATSFTATVNAPLVTTLSTVSGDGQSAFAGQSLGSPLVVEALDGGSPPASPININWTVSPVGAATVDSNPTATDATGRSQVNVTLAAGASPGPVTITATRADTGDATTFTATVNAPLVTSLTAVSGGGQTAMAGRPLTLPLIVEARDGSSVPASPVSITWTVSPAGAATLSSSTTPTDAATGKAQVTVTLAATASPGTVTITATRADSGDTASFTATVAAPVVRSLTGVSGGGQSAIPGATLPEPLVVAALDDSAPPLESVEILWTVSPTGAAIVASTTSTDVATGRSQVSVTLADGIAPGSVTVIASRADAPSAATSFVITVTEAPNLLLSAVAGDGQIGLLNQPAQPLQVRYTVGGVPRANQAISWQLVSGDATLNGASSVTGTDGLASMGLTFGNTAGPIVVRASTADTSVEFNLSAAAPALTIESGNNQSAAAGSELPEDLVVRAGVPAGSSLANQSITWEVVSGGGSLSVTSSSTDTGGLARTRLTLGTAPGPNLVRATVAGGGSVEFVATGLGVTLSVVSGNGQSGRTDTAGDQPLRVRLLSGSGAPQPDAQIEWTVIGGPIVLNQTSSTTGSDGEAETTFRYGSIPGIAQVQARLVGGSALATFTVETTQATLAGPSSGNDQTGAPGQQLPEDFVVSIAPSSRKALAGVTVLWEVTQGGGTLRSATSETDANGEARNRLTLGPAAGLNEVKASIPGGGEVVFQAQGVGVAGTLTIVSGNEQTVPTNNPSTPLVVELRDGSGTPIANARIVWTAIAVDVGGATQPNATVDEDITTTGADGRSSNIARVLLPGVARVQASVQSSDIGPVVFQLNGGVANIPTLTPDQESTSNVVDTACPALAAIVNRTPAEEDLYQRCLELIENAGDNPDEVEDALDELPPELNDNMGDAAFETLQTQFQNMSGRFQQLRQGQNGGNQFNVGLWTPTGVLPLGFLPSAFDAGEEEGSAGDDGGSDFDRWGFFATGTIGRGKGHAEGENPGFSFDTSGLTAGVDYRFTDQLVGGVSAGFARHDTELRQDAGRLDTTGWTMSGYATWFNASNWYVDGVLSYGINRYDISRRIQYSITALDGGRTDVDQVARGSTDGNLLGAAFSVGKDFQKGPWSLGTYLRGNYSRVELDGYDERLLTDRPGSGLGLRFGSRTLDSFTSVVGGKATYILSRDWGILMPTATVEWEHEFRDDPSRLTASFINDPTQSLMEQSGSAIDTDYYNVGVGISALFPGGRSVYMYYERLIGASRLSEGTLSIGGRIEF